MSQLGPTLFSCQDVSVGYPDRVVLRHVQFSVCNADYVCIAGENGAGKSTLVRTLLGLQRPLAGSIRFEQNLQSDQIGYLSQMTAAQRDFPASVWEIALSGCAGKLKRRLFYGKEEKFIAHEQLHRLGIDHLKDRSFQELSGGQQRRVLLARALCSASRLLVLDEPVAGLDPTVTHEFYDLIASLNQDGLTIVMVTHDLACVTRYARHVLWLEKGQAVLEDPQTFRQRVTMMFQS